MNRLLIHIYTALASWFSARAKRRNENDWRRRTRAWRGR